MDSNECRDLEIKDFKEEIEKELGFSIDMLSFLFNLQKDTQSNLYGFDFEEMQSKLGNVKIYLDDQYCAIQDEFRELYSALGGVDSHGSAIWKKWKSAHEEASNKSFSDLSENEIKELRFEYIDLLHFFLNIGFCLGFTPELLFNMYIAKNKENWDRQKKGY